MGNVGNLPLVLVAAVVREAGIGAPPGSELGPEDLAICYVAMGCARACVLGGAEVERRAGRVWSRRWMSMKAAGRCCCCVGLSQLR